MKRIRDCAYSVALQRGKLTPTVLHGGVKARTGRMDVTRGQCFTLDRVQSTRSSPVRRTHGTIRYSRSPPGHPSVPVRSEIDLETKLMSRPAAAADAAVSQCICAAPMWSSRRRMDRLTAVLFQFTARTVSVLLCASENNETETSLTAKIPLHCFSNRVINVWNSLPNYTVCA